MRAMTRLTCFALLLLAGCGRDLFVKVGPVTLADADGVVAPESGPLLVLGPAADAPLPSVPAGAKVVQIAAARDLPYARVRELVKAVHAAGARPVLLVGASGKPMALPHTGAAVAKSILLETEKSGDDAKACMQPPEALERQCAARPGSPHVDRAFVRQIVRDAVKGYGLDVVHVKPDEQMSWADAVRAIDGARTCCGKGATITLSIEDLEI
jgi:hypothetical protein